MDNIVAKENINITPEASEFVLNLSNLSVKTMLNYLQKFGAANIPIECRYYPRKCSRYPDSSCGAANIPIAIAAQLLSR